MIFSNAAQITYNGYTWDGACNMTIRCEPVYDEAERAVICHHYLIRVVGIIAGEAEGISTDVEMQSIRNMLTKPGKPLLIQGAGFYDLIVNQNGGVTDAQFGPKPRIVSWTPIGASYAAEVEWECETWIVFCGDAVDQIQPIAINYTATFAIDYRGLTTRTLAGYLEISLNRTSPNAQTIPRTADFYRNRITPAIPERFDRVTQSFVVSADRRRLDFQIVDQELPNSNPWPRGVVKASGTHHLGWSARGGGAGSGPAWISNRITVELEMAPNANLLNAYAAFALIWQKRMNTARAAYAQGVLIQDISVQEELFGRSCQFGVNYTVCAPLEKLLADFGLWEPLAINTWGQWSASIFAVKDERGYANMQLSQTQDVIVDPCGAVFIMPWDGVAVPEATGAEENRTLIKNEIPTAEKSWLWYRSNVYLFRDRAMVRQAVMQQPESEDPDFNPQDTGGLVVPAAGGTPDILQRGGKSRYTACLIGVARRAGHKIPKPALQQIGGAAAVEIKCDFMQDITANWLGCPIYQGSWRIWYSLASEPGAVPNQANIEQGVAADGTSTQPTGP